MSVSNKPTSSTQPCIPPGSLNRVPASAGVKAGMSPLSGGRLHCVILLWHVSSRSGVEVRLRTAISVYFQTQSKKAASVPVSAISWMSEARYAAGVCEASAFFGSSRELKLCLEWLRTAVCGTYYCTSSISGGHLCGCRSDDTDELRRRVIDFDHNAPPPTHYTPPRNSLGMRHRLVY